MILNFWAYPVMVEDLVLEVVENSRRLATDSFGSESLTKHTPSAEKRYRSCEINPCLSLLPQVAQFCVVYWFENKVWLLILRTLFLLSLFAVNFHAFNFELGEFWGHFWIALETSYSKMPSNFLWLKIKGMKIDSKNRQQNKHRCIFISSPLTA